MVTENAIYSQSIEGFDGKNMNLIDIHNISKDI